MNRTTYIALAALVIVSAIGCAPSFQMELPERFVVLEPEGRHQTSGYVQRGTTPDGVVIGLRALEHRVQGTLPFWSEAIVRRLRDQEGYAVLGRSEIQAANGQAGVLVRLGRDLNGHAYRYTIAVFVTDSYLWIADAGGREEPYEALEDDVERSIAALVF